MAEQRDAFIEKLLKGYSTYYDIERMEEDRLPLAATAFFHVHSTKYMMVKAAEIWAADSNEYLYLFTVPELNEGVFEECMTFACTDGMTHIHPDKNHMSSFIDAIFITDHVTETGEKVLRSYRNKKNFKFSLHGWMEVYAIAADLGKSEVIANRPSCENAKYVQQVMHPNPADAHKKRSFNMIKMLFQ